MRNFVIVVLMFVFGLLSQAAVGGEIFFDDFSTDPDGVWVSTDTWPAEEGGGWFEWDSTDETADFWASGGGSASYTTVATTSADPNLGYVIEVDFRINDIGGGGVGSSGPTVWAQRQGNDDHYWIRAYVGGSGGVDWYSGGGGMANISNAGYVGSLSADTWYTMRVVCKDTGSQLELQAVIFDQGTSDIAVPWSTVAVDSTPGRYISNAGFGFEGYSAQTDYDNLQDYDNFKVTQLEAQVVTSDDFSTEPSTRFYLTIVGGRGKVPAAILCSGRVIIRKVTTPVLFPRRQVIRSMPCMHSVIV